MDDKDQNIKKEEKEFDKKELHIEQEIDPGNEHNHLEQDNEQPASPVKKEDERD